MAVFVHFVRRFTVLRFLGMWLLAFLEKFWEFTWKSYHLNR